MEKYQEKQTKKRIIVMYGMFMDSIEYELNKHGSCNRFVI